MFIIKFHSPFWPLFEPTFIAKEFLCQRFSFLRKVDGRGSASKFGRHAVLIPYLLTISLGVKFLPHVLIGALILMMQHYAYCKEVFGCTH